jgi:hypothetical protein
MNTESTKTALADWAHAKGYESFLKILQSAPEIFSGSSDDLKNEGVFLLLRPLHDEFRADRVYFTTKGKIQSRKKAPTERDYILAVWGSPSGIVHISESLMIRGGGTKGTSFLYQSEAELARLMNQQHGFLNRDYVFYPAVKNWLKKNKKITSVDELDAWPNCFKNPGKLVVPFNEWLFVQFVVKETDGLQYLGVTNDGRLGLFEGGPLTEVALVEQLNSGALVSSALDKIFNSRFRF